MGKTIEQGRRHLGITEHTGPFGEAQVGGDDETRVLVEFAPPSRWRQQRTAPAWLKGKK